MGILILDTNSYNPINVTVVSLDKFPGLLSDEKPQERVINNTRGENF